MAINGINTLGIYNHVIKFDVLTNNCSVTLEAIFFGNLPSNLIMPGIKGAVEVLRRKSVKIYLANPKIRNDTVNNIKIIFGADQYFKFANKPKMIISI